VEEGEGEAVSDKAWVESVVGACMYVNTAVVCSADMPPAMLTKLKDVQRVLKEMVEEIGRVEPFNIPHEEERGRRK